MNKIDCPFCKGTGKVLPELASRRVLYDDKTRKRAFELRQKGITLRKIGKELKINSPESVRQLIKSWHRILVIKKLKSLSKKR